MLLSRRGTGLLSKARQYRVAPEVTSQVINKFLESLDCPRALTVSLLFRYGEHEQLANLEFDPCHYLNYSDLGDAYCATKFLSKYKDLTLDYDLDQVALDKFKKFELTCAHVNDRFRHDLYAGLKDPRIVWLHNAVKRKIAVILGDFSIKEFVDLADWGPGATTLLKARDASSAKKFQFETGITRDLYYFISCSQVFEEFYPRWLEQMKSVGFPTFQVGNKVVTVPKDATQNRVIAIEPGINLWFQKSVGSMLQERLLRCGIDLRDQGRNQQLARKASRDDLSATVDFSSASDSIARLLVEDLFSSSDPLWYQVMDVCRSHFGCLDGAANLRWQKFSSMGNGFTFQLESLIFYAAAVCCQEYLHLSSKDGDVSVYGDDVIVPRKCLDLFSGLVSFYGFQMNARKTNYLAGFRESCGAHYASGFDVKPIYLKGRLSDVRSVYRLANSVRRLSHRRLNRLGCDAAFAPVFGFLVNSIPKPLRFRCPEGYGDGGFISNFDEATPSALRDKKSTRGWEGFSFQCVVEQGLTLVSDINGLLLDHLWGLSKRDRFNDRKSRAMPSYSRKFSVKLIFDQAEFRPDLEGVGNSIPIRSRVKIRISRGIVKQWYDLGPWL